MNTKQRLLLTLSLVVSFTLAFEVTAWSDFQMNVKKPKKAKVVTLTDHNRSKQRNEPIRLLANCVSVTCLKRLLLVLLLIGWKNGAIF